MVILTLTAFEQVTNNTNKQHKQTTQTNNTNKQHKQTNNNSKQHNTTTQKNKKTKKQQTKNQNTSKKKQQQEDLQFFTSNSFILAWKAVLSGSKSWNSLVFFF